jgi:hypothetical protein
MNTKFKFIYLIIMGLMLLTSCSNMLDKEPYGQFTVNQMDTTSIEPLMAAAYAGLQCHFFGNNQAFDGPASNWVFDVRSDDAYKGGGSLTMEAYLTQLELGNVTSDNPVGLNKWTNDYYGIARVNNTINILKGLKPANLNELIGELRLIRGHFYFDLIRIFYNIPYIDENSNSPTDASKASPTQFTRDQIYDKIDSDFTYAYNNLPAIQAESGRFNKYAAAAYLCKLSVQRANWPDAISWANIVIGSNKYSLYNNYLDMSKIAYNNQNEAIFTIQYSTSNNNSQIDWGDLLNTTYSVGNLFGNGDDFYIGSQNLANAFRTDSAGLPYLNGTDFNSVNDTVGYKGNVDPRLDFTLGRIGMPFRGYPFTMGWCRDYADYGDHPNKKRMIDPNSPDMVQGFPWGASSLGFNVIRYADVLLWKAEAEIESNGNLDDARQLINQVRDKAARSIDPLYTPVDIDITKANYKVGDYPAAGWTQSYARAALRMERRLEFAMEGERWFDLVRWGVATTVMNTYYSQEKALRPWLSTANLSSSSIYLPIPISEVENSGGVY